MHVDDSEALKKWLIAKIRKLCEADEVTLAKYILTLVRKDKPVDELYRFCVLQLYAFFQKNTKAFVNKLFDVLTNKKYMVPSEVNNDVTDIIGIGTVRPYTEAEFRAEYPKEYKDHDSFHQFIYSDAQILKRFSKLNSIHEMITGINNLSRYSGVLGLSYEGNNCGISAASGHSGAHGSRTVERNLPGTSQSKRSFLTSEAPLYVPTATKKVKNFATSSSSNISSMVNNGCKRERCSDYDKKGFCMKGNSCPYDHGSDPLIVNVDSGLGLKVPTSQVSSTGFNMNFSLKPPLPSHPPPPLPPLPKSPPPPLSDFPLPEPYNPESPGMNMDEWSKSYNDYKRAHASHLGLSISSGGKAVNYDSSFSSYKPQRARELIGVTISNNSSVGRNTRFENVADNNKNRKGFNFLDFPKKVTKMAYKKSTLEVRKIPTHLNKIEYLIGHFGKFGNVIHIQIEYDGDPEAALVQYSKEEEALAAHRCPEPVLGNRFIKIFFQKQDGILQTTKSDLSNDLNSASVSRASSKPFHKPPTRGAYKYAPGKNIQRDNASAMNMRWNLYKRKQELLKERMSNQRLIMGRLESCKRNEDKVVLKKFMFEETARIKALQDELKMEGTELKAHFEAVANKTGSSKVIPIKQEAVVDELEAQALKIIDTAKASSGNQARKSDVEEASNGSSSLSTYQSPDIVCPLKNRVVLTASTDKIDKEDLKKHFQKFGVIKNIDDTSGNKIITTFAKPEEADKAFLLGKQLGDADLNLSLNHEPSTSSVIPSDTDLECELPSRFCLSDDDDEEEESKARSWRP